MKLGEKLLKERESKKLTQKKVEGITGINRSVLSLYEANQREISLSNLSKLSNCYGRTIEFFLSEKKEEPLTVSYRAEKLSEEDTERIEWAKNFVINLYEIEELINN